MTGNIGKIRPSQLLWSYGPGALIDLPNLSVITMGLDKWDVNKCSIVVEERLLTGVKKILGTQVKELRIPPLSDDDNQDPFSPESRIGIPVQTFPRWLRCVKCGLLADVDLHLFKLKENPYKPEKTHYVHSGCTGSKNNLRPQDADAVPVRFMLACPNGHLDDFPWHWFVHNGPSQCKGTLRFFEKGASLQTENLWVKCDECGNARSLAHAFGDGAKENLPDCRGRHPHLGKYEACTEPPRAVLLGSTNSWFPVSLSALAIPTEDNTLAQIIKDYWDKFKSVTSLQSLKEIMQFIKLIPGLQELEKYSEEEIFEVINCIRNDINNPQPNSSSFEDFKRPEWNVFISNSPLNDWPHFLSKRVESPSKYKDIIKEVLLVERLKEVNALVGYTRIDSPDEFTDEEEFKMAPISNTKPTWVPAMEVHGEGIFIRFNDEKIKLWESKTQVLQRNQVLLRGHQAWRNARRLNPELGYPGIRYVMLHTLSHLLIRELALECGYNAASIKERIYASRENEEPMAGILLYTAAADSDGTLGGLVELGNPENLERLIDQSLRRAEICSSDPLCAEHEADKDRSLHMSACHACTFVSETSCERGNRYLDRALIVKTLDCKATAFF